MEPLDPCRVCLGTGHLSPGCGARDERDYGKECHYCEGTGVDHDPSEFDGDEDPDEVLQMQAPPPMTPAHNDGEPS